MKYPLTIIGILVLVALLIIAAVFIGGGEQGQRFILIVGVITTTLTALLALLRLEITAHRTESIETKLDENTAVSAQAFSEANSINAKIAAQGKQFDAVLARALDTATRREERSADVADDTHAKVEDIHDAVVVKDG